MSTKVTVFAAVLVALSIAVGAAVPAATTTTTTPAAGAAAAPKGCTITIQFDNDLRKVNKARTSTAIIQVLAKDVFKVPPSQVQQVGQIDQSGVLTSQSVVSFRAVPAPAAAAAANPCAACEDAVKNRWLGLRGSSLKEDIAKATDTWWPNDKAKVQKATCKAS